MRFRRPQDELERERILTLAMRAALLQRPGPAAQDALVRRMAETARIAQQEAGDATKRAARRSALPARRSRLGLAARLAGAVSAFVLAMAGLAVAGVKLPQPARSALHNIGVHLPNQATHVSTGQSSGEPADQAVPAGKPPAGDRGKSKAAHQRVREARARRLAKGHGRKLGYTRGKAIGLNEATPPGQTSPRGGGHHSAPANGGPSPNPHSGSNRRGHKGTPAGHASGKSKGPKPGAHRP
jgi:hypothetical protein